MSNLTFNEAINIKLELMGLPPIDTIPFTYKDLYPHEIKVSKQTIDKMYMGALKNGKS